MYILFFKQKTAYEMRISDWSSDVCSSDLATSEAVPNPGIFVSSINDAPTVTLPGSISVLEDTNSPLTGISFADVDAGSTDVTTTFSVPNGTLSDSSGGGVIVTGKIGGASGRERVCREV